jgi:hypothetical protein
MMRPEASGAARLQLSALELRSMGALLEQSLAPVNPRTKLVPQLPPAQPQVHDDPQVRVSLMRVYQVPPDTGE